MERVEIHCPKCRWRPTADDRWQCSRRMGGCGHAWDTFLTGGVCPSCACRWEITACPACLQYSLHKDWYHRCGLQPAATLERGAVPGTRVKAPEPVGSERVLHVCDASGAPLAIVQ